MQTSNELRQAFLDFFASKGHRVQPGISLVPTDPSLFLTGAGVVPFRHVIEGREEAPAPRIATCQRCVRTNDIENVGRFARYHTFFEMLGNFSFGDYYKRESVQWGWEFVTEVLGLEKERIWATVFGNHPEIPDDDEGFDIWHKEIGLPADRIIKLADNWWGPVAETGACGPDSEIYYDLGPEFGCGGPECAPGCDCDRYLEFWNHVFTERFKEADGSFGWLPKKNIDTGMGLERLTCIVQGKSAVYETDLFAPIMDRVDAIITEATGAAGERSDWRKRVIADHSRGVTFLIMDGIYPENTGRGYVLRRILRRAATFGRLLGVKRSFIHEIVPIVVEKMASGYPELRAKEAVIIEAVRREEERFGDALDRGMPLLIAQLEKSRDGILDGKFSFRMWDTYGMPYELQLELAAEYNAAIDEQGYQQAAADAKAMSQGAHGHLKDLGTAIQIQKTEFVGYERTEGEALVLAVLKEGGFVEALEAGEEGQVILDLTPFYGESGGQIGDTGRISGGTALATVLDTHKQDNVFIHRVKVEEGRLHADASVRAQVDVERRDAIKRAHTATHLLHAALRQTLGEHVVQRGSVVEPDRLRFDFANPEAVTPEQVERVERIVNERVLQDIAVSTEQKPIDEARQMGAMALFGEKYGDIVRVVQVPGFSTELCGGTHVSSTGAIGLIKITSETSVAAGVRRIDATTGLGSLAYAQHQASALQQVAADLGGPVDQIQSRIQAQRDQIAQLRRQLNEARRAAAGGQVDQLLGSRAEVEGVSLIAAATDATDPDAIKSLVDTLAQRLQSGVVLLGGGTDGKAVFVVKVSADLVQRGVHAGNLVREVAKIAGGGGGGRPDFAQAGGKDAAKVPDAVGAAAELLRGQLQR